MAPIGVVSMHLLIVLAAFALVGTAPFLSPQPPNTFYQIDDVTDEDVGDTARLEQDERLN
jgi:hypothetical protein